MIERWSKEKRQWVETSWKDGLDIIQSSDSEDNYIICKVGDYSYLAINYKDVPKLGDIRERSIEVYRVRVDL